MQAALRCDRTREVPVEKLAVRSAPSAAAEPAFGASFSRDAEAASKYFVDVEARLHSARADGRRDEAAALKARARAVKEHFFRLHAAAIYDELTDHCVRSLRASELLAAASGRYPAMLPTRERIDEERALMQQSAKQGREIDQ